MLFKVSMKLGSLLVLFLLLNVWALLYKMIYVQSLTLKGCFYIYLLKLESFSALVENPFLRGALTRMICDITNSLKASTCPTVNLQMCDVEIWNLWCTYAEERL